MQHLIIGIVFAASFTNIPNKKDKDFMFLGFDPFASELSSVYTSLSSFFLLPLNGNHYFLNFNK